MTIVISDSPEVIQTLPDARVIVQTSATAWSADSILSNVIKAQLGKESDLNQISKQEEKTHKYTFVQSRGCC